MKGITQVDSSKTELNIISTKLEPQIHQTAFSPLMDEYAFYLDTTEIKYVHLLNKIDHLLAIGELKLANTTVARIPIYGIPPQYLSHYYKSAALCSYLNQESDNALSIIQQYELTDSIHMIQDTAAQLLKCLIHLSLDDYSAVENSFNSIKKKYKLTTQNTHEIDSLIQVGRQLKLKSAKKAALLSAIIPGSGQLYLGHFEEGLVNFGLNLTTLGFTAFCVYKGYYATGILVGYTLFQRFYTGGLRRTDKLTTDYNNALTIPLKQNLKERLIRLNLQTK